MTTRGERALQEIRARAYDLDLGVGTLLERIRAARVELSEDSAPAISAGEDVGAGPLVAFVHIPKTAGGTVTAMLAAAYSGAGIYNVGNYMTGPEKAVAKIAKGPEGWERWQRRGGRVAVGHVPYWAFREHLPTEARAMTFLREPVDRVLSHFYRHIFRRTPRSPERRARRLARERSRRGAGSASSVWGRAKADSLEEALIEMRLPQLSNLATRFLCGDRSLEDELPANALDEAKANLREFAFVGVQERFEESLVLMSRALDLGPVPRAAFEDRHVSISAGRPAVDEISDEQRALILEHNRLDVELYAFGQELFEEAVAATADDRFEAEVGRLRGLSAAAARKRRRARSAAGGDDSASLIACVLMPVMTPTVASILRHAYSPGGVHRGADFLGHPETAARKLDKGPGGWEIWQHQGGRATIGPVPYGVFREHLPASTRYFTFLGDPISRALDRYRQLQRANGSADPSTPADAASLEEALVEMRLPQLSNLATRFLCGSRSLDDELPPNALDEAKANLREFAFVGIQERLEESLVLMSRALELGPVPREALDDGHIGRASRRSAAAEEIRGEERALIVEHNRLDVELYAFAQELFEEALVAATDADFTAEVETLRNYRSVPVKARRRAARRRERSGK